MNKLLYILILSVLFSVEVFPAGREKSVSFINESVRKVGEQVEISMDILVDKWNPKYRLTVTPVVYTKDQQIKLSSYQLVGKYRHIADIREGVASPDDYVINRKTTKAIPYRVTIPYAEWMSEVSIGVEQLLEGCCSVEEIKRVAIAENKLLFYQLTPKFRFEPYDYELTELEEYTINNPFLHSMEEYDKRYDILIKDRDKGTSVVVFTVGSHKLDMDFQGNKDVLDAIAKAFKLIEDDPNAVLTRIMVSGYASPEGTLAFNTALAQRRVETVKGYIQTLMSSSNEHLFELHNGREDWNGLREKVENSNMLEKNEVLTIIDSYTMEQEVRKTKLRQLYGGKPYKYMLENFYPSLRSAGYVQVYYEIDRKATIATAVTDELGRTTYVDPESPENKNITRVNEAIPYLKAGDFEKALISLLQASEDPKTFNYIGVCYMMKGQYDEAEPWLRKALENNDPYAQENIDQINIARRVE